MDEEAKEGRYVYCVADKSRTIKFGKIGIKNNNVYTISHKDLCAVVHNCKSQAYVSDDEEKVKNWIKTHQNVIDVASEKLGAVVPLTFDIIVKGSNEDVVDWLRKDYERLKKILRKVKNKQEFGIQIFWDEKKIGDKIAETNQEIQNLKEGINKVSEGEGYFYKNTIETILKREMEKKADEHFKKFYDIIKNYVNNIKIDKIKKEKGKQMLMNLSCLVHENKVKNLGRELERINKLDGFSVKFTGPWPPYSFVSPG